MSIRTNLLKELEKEFLPTGKKETAWKRVCFFLLLVVSIGVGLLSLYGYLKGVPKAARLLGIGIMVQTVTVKEEPFTEIIGASGKTAPAAIVEIKSSVGGTVLFVPVEVGTTVPKDHVLAQLDPAPYKTALQFAQGKFTKAKTDFEKSELFEKRMNELFARKLISSTALEKATRELVTARVHFSDAAEDFLMAQDNLDHVVITARAPGVILEQKIKQGQIVNPKESLFILGTTDSVRVVASVAQEQADRIAPGQEADLVMDAYPKMVLTGEVEKINPVASAEGTLAMHKVNVSIRVKSDLKIKTGLPAYVWIKNHRKGLTIPKFSIIQPSNANSTSASHIGTTTSGQPAVFVVEDLRARMQPIRIGVTRKNKVEVLEGLEEGQEIVSRGLSDLKDNDRVRMKE